MWGLAAMGNECPFFIRALADSPRKDEHFFKPLWPSP